MAGEGISQLPVVDENNRVIGSIRERTISNHLLSHGKDILERTINEFVEESFPQFPAGSVTIGEISKMILEHDAILLMDKGKIAGIITKADIIRSAVE
ncbi:MAG: CBS domain-containing protein [Candidatus Helarchaeota archaeon]